MRVENFMALGPQRLGDLRVSRSGWGLQNVDKAAGLCSLGRKPSRYCTPGLLLYGLMEPE